MKAFSEKLHAGFRRVENVHQEQVKLVRIMDKVTERHTESNGVMERWIRYCRDAYNYGFGHRRNGGRTRNVEAGTPIPRKKVEASRRKMNCNKLQFNCNLNTIICNNLQ